MLHRAPDRFSVILAITASCFCLAPHGPWDNFNLAPESRFMRPKSIHSLGGDIHGQLSLIGSTNTSGIVTLSGIGSFVTLDFGQEVGGRVSFIIVNSRPDSALSLSFTESPQFINPFLSDDSCRSVATMDSDGVQSLPPPLEHGKFTQTIGEQRGGFRYLTLVANSNGPVSIAEVGVESTFMPHWDDLRAYTGYFSAKDPGYHDVDFLTRLWYAGAYTVQTNTIDSHQARQFPCPLPKGWANNDTGGPVDGPILVDGAKRDRTVWPGDLGISTHTELVALNDLLPTINGIRVMFSTQDPATGALQYSGPPINAKGSDAYIAWSLIGTYNAWLYTGDVSFVRSIWTNYTKALAFLESQVDRTGLMDVPVAFSQDWGREGGQGHNSAANVLLYRALITGSELARQLGDAELASAYAANATDLKGSINRVLWDEPAGMYRDNETTTIHPQDANSLAVLFNVTQTQEQNEAISEGLTRFWTDIGPISPELADTIIPFIGGFELRAHFIAGQGERALELMRKEWGYMLMTDLSVHSTLLEGFTGNGSLAYRASEGYNFDLSDISHSHGWATGPTSALTFHVLGITLTSPLGRTWNIAPVLSGLEAAEGGFETGLGWFGVKWFVKGGHLTIKVSTPKGTSGVLKFPGSGLAHINGKSVGSKKEIHLDGGDYNLSRSLS